MNLIAKDKNPIPVIEDVLIILAFNTILEALLFPPPMTVLLKISQSSTCTWLLLLKKRVVIKWKNLAYLSLRIKFKAIRQAENLRITLSRSV